MVRSGEGLNTSMNLRSRSKSNNKQNLRTDTTDVDLQNKIDILEEIKLLPYQGYRRKQSKNKPTESYSFQVKQISKLLKIKKHILDFK